LDCINFFDAPKPFGLLRGSTSLRLPGAFAEGHALSCSAASQAGRPSLRSGLCLASQLREPARFAYGFALVSLRMLRNRYAFPCLPPGRPRPSRLFAGEQPAASRLGAAEPYRFARTFATPGGGLRGHSFCYSRKIVNPAPHMSFPRKRESRGSGCLSLSFPQYGFAFNIYTSRAVSFRRRFAGVSKAKRRGISSRIGQ